MSSVLPVHQRLGDPVVVARVEEFMRRMSLEQKVCQMTQADRSAVSAADLRRFPLGAILSGAGSVPEPNTPAQWVRMNDAYWEASRAASGIPLLYGVDAIHGHNNVAGATVFPHNIGLGATRDPALIERIARATAMEVLATGVDWTFAPTLAVARNPRWGRTYESYSDDPAIVESFAPAMVRGLQHDLGSESVMACLKHWVGDGGTSNGIDQGDTTLSLEELDRTHIRPYRAAIKAGALSVMVSFSSWNGDKCHGHRELVSTVLKSKLGFGGLVLSDWNGISYLSEDPEAAVAMGVNAGIDMFMVPQDWERFIAHLLAHVRRGSVPQRRIDDAVRRILTVKCAFGLFDKPRPAQRPGSNRSVLGCGTHRALAREAVRRSLVLLKNENSTLPIPREARVLVAGKNADNRGHQCGGFTIDWQGVEGNDAIAGGTSIWEGIRSLAPNAEFSADGELADRERHDLAIVVIGETPYAEGLGDIRRNDNLIVEAGSLIKGTLKMLRPYGRSLELANRHPEDLALMRRIAAKGIPVVAVLVSGRALVVNPELDISAAFVAAWLPGSEGAGVADLLFGVDAFSGRLSFDWPAHDNGTSPEPLRFPRGFGLGTNGLRLPD